MAYVYKDMWGKDQVGGVQDDINKAVKDRDFTRGVGQIQDDLQKKMERNLVVGAAGTAAMVAGTGFFLFRWIRHLKNDLYYRYKWELRLHYVAASFLWCYVLGTIIDKAPLFIYERTGKVVQWLVDAPPKHSSSYRCHRRGGSSWGHMDPCL